MNLPRFLLAVLCTLTAVRAQTPAELLPLGTRLSVDAATEITRMDRQTGSLVSEADIVLKNTGDRPILPPFVLAVELEAPANVEAVRVTGTQGGVGVAPWQWPWLDLSTQAGAQLLPDATISFKLTLSRPAGVTPTYRLVAYGKYNRDPLAVPRASGLGIVNSPTSLDGTLSSDPDGDALTYAWDFGDGTNATGATPQHTFTRTGTFSVSLTVTDPHGAANTRSVPVIVTPEGQYALARSRALAADGVPLDGVTTEQSGPGGNVALPLTAGDGFLSLGGLPGAFTWKFSKPGYLSVYRQATLADRQLSFVPTPWLTPLSGESVALSPLFERLLRGNGTAIVVNVPQGAASSAGDAKLTALGPQALPLPLPLGWSPVAALHLDLGTVSLVNAAKLTFTTPALRNDAPRVLVQFNEQLLTWLPHTVLAAGAPLEFDLRYGGTFALVIPDAAPTAPPLAVPGAPLPPFTGALPDLSALTGQVAATPNPSTASTDPKAITAAASAAFTVPAPVPSGIFLRADLDETYTLRGGAEVPGAPWDTTIAAWRPLAGGLPGQLVSSFPIRPTSALGQDLLAEAKVLASIQATSTLSAAIVTADGGSASLPNFRLDAAAGAFTGPGIVELRDVPLASLTSLLGTLQSLRAFDVNVSGLPAGRALEPWFTGLVPNADFLLARVVRTARHSGLEPALRLRSRADGRSTSAEPATGPRLPGVDQSGRYVLLKLAAPLGLVDGLARNAAGQLTAGLLARVKDQPWLALTRSGGVFRLLAPPGDGKATLTDDLDEDYGETSFILADANAVVSVTVALSGAGLRILTTTPAADATAVPVITSVVVRFNRKLDPASFGPDAITLTAGASTVTASLTLNLAGNEATLLPASPLDFLTEYTITAAATLRDLTGSPLNPPRDFQFTTAGQPARPGSELTIYEPGAANVPQEILDRLVQYTPGQTSRQVIAVGGPGTAEGRAAVTLVNVTTGETATTVAAADGSFTNWLRADKEDYIQAVIRNSNGTTTRLDATRQLFDDGRVGLYGPGGLLSEETPAGPVEVEVAPGTVPTRTEFQVTPLTVAQINAELGGVQPEGGAKIAAGARILVLEQQPAGVAEVSFALDPAILNLPAGETAEAGAFALCYVEDIEGAPVFRVVDQMFYANGQLKTVSPAGAGGRSPARGIGASAAFIGGVFPGVFGAYAPHGTPGMLAAVYLGGGPQTVGGKVALKPPGADMNLEIAAPTGPAVSGASVFAFQAGAVSGRDQFGRIPGWIYCTSDRDGHYALVMSAAYGSATVGATHPHFRDARVGGPSAVSAQSFTRNIVFDEEREISLGTTLESSHLPLFPVPGQEVILTVTASRGGTEVPVIALPKVERLLALQPGVTFTPPTNGVTPEVIITAEPVVTVDGRVRAPFKIKTTKPLRVTLEIKATVAGEDNRRRHVIDFNGTPAFDGTLAASDRQERMPPQVAGSFPRPREYLTQGSPLELWFSEAVDRSVVSQVHLITLSEGVATAGAPAPPVAGGPPTASLSDDQRRLKLWFGGIKPGKVYTLSVPPGAVMDLNRTPLDQNPATRDIREPFTLTFRSAEQYPLTNPAPGNLSDLAHARGGGVLLGSVLLVGDGQGVPAPPAGSSAVSGDGALRAYDVSKPQTPRALLLCDVFLPGPPTAITLIPDYEFWAKLPGKEAAINPNPAPENPDPARNPFLEKRRRNILAVAGGRVGVTPPTQYLWLFEVLDGAPGHERDFPDYHAVNKPVKLLQIAASPVHADPDSIVVKMVWQAPHLAFLELISSAATRVNLLNVQEFIRGNQLTREERTSLPLEGVDNNLDGDFYDLGESLARLDVNGDGDYVDPGDIVPTPPRVPHGFYGFAGTYSSSELQDDGTFLNTTQAIRDFDFKGGVLAGILSNGTRLDAQGQGTGPPLPPVFRVFSAGVNLEAAEGVVPLPVPVPPVPGQPPPPPPDANPKRVLLLPDFPIEVPVTVPPPAPGATPRYNLELRSLALVTLSPDNDRLPKLVIIDISNPRAPVILNRIRFPSELLLPDSRSAYPPDTPPQAHLQSLTLRPDGMLELQTSLHTMILNPRLLLRPGPADATRMHDAITGVLRNTGTGSFIPIQGAEGLRVIAELGRALVIQTPPEMEFRFFPELADDDFIHRYAPAFRAEEPDEVMDRRFAVSTATTNLTLSRYRTVQTPPIASTLTPASSKTHYSIIVRAPGGGGPTIQLGLHSLNDQGWPRPDAPAGLAPTRALAPATVTALGGQPASPLAPRIRPLLAHRLSNRPASRYYNVYVSEPVAFLTEQVTRAEVELLTAGGRHVFSCSSLVQAFVDPAEEARAESVVKPWAARVDTASKELDICAFALARGVPADFVPGTNPPPVVPGNVMAAGEGSVMVHSGEVWEQASDLALPSRRMPVVFTRTVGNHNIALSAFGPGWDFNYNQRLFVFDPPHIGETSGLLLLLRDTPDAADLIQPKDLVFINGAGRALLFKFKNRAADPDAARGLDNDPLVLKLDGFKDAVAFYQCKDPAVFDIFARFADGGFGRLTPDGTQYRYSDRGVLQSIIEKHGEEPPEVNGEPGPSNRHELIYRSGRLREIHDRCVTGDRFIRIGYYLTPQSRGYEPNLDLTEQNLTDQDVAGQMVPPPAPLDAFLGKIARLVDPWAAANPGNKADVRYYYDTEGYLERVVGPRVSSTSLNESFRGRASVRYLYDQASHLFRGVADGAALTNESARFAAEFNFDPARIAPAESGRAGPKTSRVVTRYGATDYRIGPGSDYAANAGGQTTVTSPAGRLGVLRLGPTGKTEQIKLSGDNITGTPEWNFQFDHANRLTEAKTPSGDFVTVYYDHDNPFLRGRGNIRRQEMTPRQGQGTEVPLTATNARHDPLYNQPIGEHTDFNGFKLIYALTGDKKRVAQIEYQDDGTPAAFLPFYHKFDYNEFGQVKWKLLPDGRAITRMFDSVSGFTTSENDTGPLRRHLYDPGTRAGRYGLPSYLDMPDALTADYQLFYDERLYITSWRRGTYAERYAYDVLGNTRVIERDVAPGKMQREVHTFDDLNRLKTTQLVDVESSIQDGLSTLENLLTTLTYEDTDKSRLRSRVLTGNGGDPITENFTWTGLGQPLSSTRGTVRMDFTYDAEGNLKEEKQNGQQLRTFDYDRFNRLKTTRHLTAAAAGQNPETADVESITYERAGRITTHGQVNAHGVTAVVTLTYDAIGREISRLVNGDTVSPQTSTTYAQNTGAGGMVTTRVTNAAGLAPEFLYDEIQEMRPDGFVSFMSTPLAVIRFDPTPNLLVARRVTTEYLAGAGGAAGQRDFTSEFAYNQLDHLTEVFDDLAPRLAGRPKSQYTRRPDGQATRFRDGRNAETKYEQSRLGELMETVRPNQVAISSGLDFARRLTRQSDAEPKSSRYEYFPDSDRLKKHTALDGGITEFSNYDPGTELPQTISRANGAVTIEQTFDRRGQMLTQSATDTASDPVVRYWTDVRKYDAAGRILEVLYGEGRDNKATFDYDAGGPLLSSKWEGPEYVTERKVEYAWHPNGYLRSIKYPSGITLNHTRDKSGRLVAVAIVGSGVPGGDGEIWRANRFHYAGPPDDITNGPVRQKNVFDELRRLRQAEWKRTSNNALIAELRYAWDAADRPIARQDVHRGGRTDFYSTDPAGRLTHVHTGARPLIVGAGIAREQGFDVWTAWNQAGLSSEVTTLRADFDPGRWQREYRYDNGNLDLLEGGILQDPHRLSPNEFTTSRLARNAGRAAEGLILQTGVLSTRTTDGRGNITASPILHRSATIPAIVPTRASLSYDGHDRLIAANTDIFAGGDFLRCTYNYRFDGLRSRRQTWHGQNLLEETIFLYDGDLLIEEWTRRPAVSNVYALTARYYYAGDDVPFAADLGDAGGTLRRRIYLTDHAGSVHAIADGPTGEVLERITYDAFGQPRIEARDTAPPAVTLIESNSANSFFIHFSETVLPPLDRTPGGFTPPADALLTAAASLEGRITVTDETLQAVIQVNLSYVEKLPGQPGFGSLLHVRRATGDFTPGNLYRITIRGGLLPGQSQPLLFQDEWGLPSAALEITRDNLGTGTPAAPATHFNNPASTAAAPLSRSTLGNRFLFHGQYFDYETGLYYLRARHYDPHAGEFLQRDPVEYEDSPQPYAAFRHNPAAFRDPSGKLAFIPLLIMAGKAISVGGAFATGYEIGSMYNDSRQGKEVTTERKLRALLDVATMGTASKAKAATFAMDTASSALSFKEAKDAFDSGNEDGAMFNLTLAATSMATSWLPAKWKPNVMWDHTMPKGEGFATTFGDIVVSAKGSAFDRARVLLHEKVHSFLRPEKGGRISMALDRAKMFTYNNSHLLRYGEEALAETIAQVKHRDKSGISLLQAIKKGVNFPFGHDSYRLNKPTDGIRLGLEAVGAVNLGYELWSSE